MVRDLVTSVIIFSFRGWFSFFYGVVASLTWYRFTIVWGFTIIFLLGRFMDILVVVLGRWVFLVMTVRIRAFSFRLITIAIHIIDYFVVSILIFWFILTNHWVCLSVIGFDFLVTIVAVYSDDFCSEYHWFNFGFSNGSNITKEVTYWSYLVYLREMLSKIYIFYFSMRYNLELRTSSSEMTI